jgi:hypothetical protein
MRYIPVLEGRHLNRGRLPCRHRDVFLPHGWHLNRGRIYVPPPPTDRQSLRQEMRRRMERLLQHKEVYRREDY